MVYRIFHSLTNGVQQFIQAYSELDTSANSAEDNFHNQARRGEGVYRWFRRNFLSTFRYGMILLYVGTLLIVIGYHNPWIVFAR